MEKINFNLSHNDLRQYFAGIVTGEDVKNNKPAPDIYLHALDIAKVNKNEAVIFEDAPNGVESGLNAGIDVVLVPDQVMPSEEITKSKRPKLKYLKTPSCLVLRWGDRKSVV